MKNLGEHAIVIGASMGGLLAARVLSDFFTTVTVLERDGLAATDLPRKGCRKAVIPMGSLRAAARYSTNSSPDITTRLSRKATG
ncbi:hypothetical protein ACFQI9_36295 [Paraburkholderia dipogonis]|uniref:hypothetical protein n=1 Tax=Paraburkholderia dipogonis TaxID=1211383 RepID=UPI00360F40B8